MAVDDKPIRRARIEPNRERPVLTGMSGARTEHAIAARNIAVKRARCRTHIMDVHVKKSLQ
jgi:hypothetical protein